MGLFRVLAVMAMAVVAAPALAQTSGGDPPDYVLEEDGTVVIDGDGGTDCRSFASFLEQGYFEPQPGDPSQQAQSILEQCDEAGFLESGEGTKSAPAQGGEIWLPDASTAPRDEGSLYRGAYEVTEDGALIYGGDVVYQCEALVSLGAPAKPGDEDVTEDGAVVEPLTREAVELCAEAGFLPAGAVLEAPASPVASAGPDGALPETGGPSLPVPLLAAAAALLATGLLALRVIRR